MPITAGTAHTPRSGLAGAMADAVEAALGAPIDESYGGDPLDGLASGIATTVNPELSATSNTFSESFAFPAQAGPTHQQALTESNYSDAWWAHKPLSNHSLFEVDVSGAVRLEFQAHAAEDNWNATFQGPGIGLNLSPRWFPQRRGQRLVLAARLRVSNPTSYGAAGQWVRPSIVMSGYNVGSGTVSWLGVTLEANTGVKRVTGFRSMSGAGSYWGTDTPPNDTYFTTGTEFELFVSESSLFSFRYRRSGDPAWISGAATARPLAFVPAAAYFVIGHSAAGTAAVVRIDQVAIRVEAY